MKKRLLAGGNASGAEFFISHGYVLKNKSTALKMYSSSEAKNYSALLDKKAEFINFLKI